MGRETIPVIKGRINALRNEAEAICRNVEWTRNRPVLRAAWASVAASLYAAELHICEVERLDVEWLRDHCAS